MTCPSGSGRSPTHQRSAVDPADSGPAKRLLDRAQVALDSELQFPGPVVHQSSDEGLSIGSPPESTMGMGEDPAVFADRQVTPGVDEEVIEVVRQLWHRRPVLLESASSASNR